MRNLLGRSRRGQVDQALLLKIRKELEDKYSRTQSEKDFIHRNDTRAIMSRERVRELFQNLTWYHEGDRDMLWKSMSFIFCILITINFTAWEQFKTIFFESGRTLEHARCSDDSLPLEEHDATFLPPDIRQSFLRQQYVFIPIVIEKGSHREYRMRDRLPILEAEPIAENGSQGEVDKVLIEKGYLQTDPNTHNTEKKVMARKTITTKTRTGRQNFSTEKANLEAFTRSLVNHRNIMQSFATMIHGSNFMILSEWADGRDLNQFLYNPDKVLNDYPERSHRFTPHNLFMEAYSLAEALRFLHSGMSNNRGTRMRCAHLDLKPENILVCFPHNANPVDFPVGRWKISDFGLSNIEESVVGTRLVPVPPPQEHSVALAPGKILHEMSIHPVKRGAGPFQPPEVRDSITAKVSTARDVWSFGCILFMILAFSLGGPEEVSTQLQCRSGGTDDYFYRRERGHNPYMSTEHITIKAELITWLRSKVATHTLWVEHCSTVILKLLNVDVVQRPSMDVAIADLGMLLIHTEAESRRLWGFAESSYAPEVSDIPALTIESDQGRIIAGTEPAFVGAPSNSSGSPTSQESRQRFINVSPSINTRFRSDPSSSYVKMEAPEQCDGATLCRTTKRAAFWSKSMLYVYDISTLSDESGRWSESLSGNRMGSSQLGGMSRQCIENRPDFSFHKVVVAGPYLATIQFQAPSFYQLSLHMLYLHDRESDAVYGLYYQKIFHTKPVDIKLSVIGHCLIRFSDSLQVITPQGVTPPIPLGDKEAVGADFSGDGSAFCLWERDEKGHYWSVWRSDFKLLGDTIKIPHQTWGNRPPALDAYLLPFTGYSRFVACDKRGNVYLVRADQMANRVSFLGQTDRVFAGLMAPDDESFVFIRASQHGNQNVQKIVLSSMSDVTSFRPFDCGKLPRDFNKSTSGIAIRACTSVADALSLITALPNGVLTRKTF